ncbi:helix-turn-helix domain-containing protein [Chitinophaga sp. GbtcB8]|uniref:helix-turn-helix domain-containing protein n=1 Tax=Chitinophaga sp. GbtcB8 TaxID=2824753 RepID=UPI001C306D15|nr:helix-turn-helix domain-containing protein [Chitinophaga sp. GbtcB8]
MDTLFIPNENDFRKWIREAVLECMGNNVINSAQPPAEYEEPLLSRKEIAGIFRISLVTLHDWVKRGLPRHKQRGRVYFLRSEVLDYVKKNRQRSF